MAHNRRRLSQGILFAGLYALAIPRRIRSMAMNEDQVKGVGEKVKGKINKGVGKMTDDPAQEAKGDAQQIAGEARKQVGNAE